MILYDIFLILSLPALAASILAVVLMRRALSAGRRLSSSAGLTASALCARMLKAAGIRDVRVRKSEIAPKDLFRPSRGIVTLSPEHYNATDLPALAAAAFETAHALQEKAGNRFVALREIVVRVISALKFVSWPLLIVGLIFAIHWMSLTGIAMFTLLVAAGAALQPMEQDAAKRACRVLKRGKYLTDGELIAAEKLVRANALACLAAPLDAIVILGGFLVRLCADAGKSR